MFLIVSRLRCSVNNYSWKHLKNNVQPSKLSVEILGSSFASQNKHCNTVSVKAQNICDELSDKLSVNSEEIKDKLSSCSELANVPLAQWDKCIKVLSDNGFSSKEILFMVTSCPLLLQRKTEDVEYIFEVWRTSHMGQNYLQSLIKFCPQFLMLTPEDISYKIPVLKSLGTWRYVVNLLKGAPNIMFENSSLLEAKISFLESEMKVKKTHIVKSFALNRSLMFLKSRFIFLKRCGKYVKPREKDDVILPNKNASVSRIVSLTDEEFATELAGVSLEEFEVFKDLFSIEVETSEDGEDDDFSV